MNRDKQSPFELPSNNLKTCVRNMINKQTTPVRGCLSDKSRTTNNTDIICKESDNKLKTKCDDRQQKEKKT